MMFTISSFVVLVDPRYCVKTTLLGLPGTIGGSLSAEIRIGRCNVSFSSHTHYTTRVGYSFVVITFNPYRDSLVIMTEVNAFLLGKHMLKLN